MMEFIASTVAIGVGATMFVDLWAMVRRSVFGVPLPNYALVGRWFAHMSHGVFRHDSISAAAAMPAEHVMGWIAHYVIGIAYAGLLLAVAGLEWAHRPTLLPAFFTGIGTVAAPFLVMQPAMGSGVAASRTPRPAFARMHSLVTHAWFGVGLYLAGCIVARIALIH